jgi:5-methylcytosine-specific restriction enzyme subunit McrC
VLRNQAIEHRHGGVHVDGFLVDMAKVFETFVTRVLTDALQAIDGRVAAQWRGHLDVARAVDIRPDVVWLRAGKPAAVLDVKYKAEKPEGYPNADAYQALAYATALGLPAAHLVYAKGEAVARTHVVLHSGVEITTHAVDLDLPPADLVASLHSLANGIHRALPD